MSFINDFETYYGLIESRRATDRKRAYDTISIYLENNDYIQQITAGDYWNRLLQSCQRALRQELEKISDDTKKKTSRSDNQFEKCKDLLDQIVKKSLINENDQLDIPSLVSYLCGCLREKSMKTHCETSFLLLLKHAVFSGENRFGKLDGEHWILMFELIKDLLEPKSGQVNNVILKYTCIKLMIKFGPSSGFPATFLREQFQFVCTLFKKVSRTSVISQQTEALEMLLEFCKHVVEDNRVSCIRLGETVYMDLFDLYEFDANVPDKKNFTIEFMLLQTSIHNPNGVSEGHPAAYACNWKHWKSCLNKMYILLSKEIDGCVTKRYSSPFFNSSNFEISNSFMLLFVEVLNQLLMEPKMVTIDISCTGDCVSQTPKKRKIEISIEALLTKIKETKHWIWISLIGNLIATYPKVIKEELFCSFLQFLYTLQVDIKNSAILNSICDCLTKLLGVQKHFDVLENKLEIDKLWKQIGEVTLRAVGLNQNSSPVHNLLQSLILERNYVDLDLVLDTYNSEVKNFTPHCVELLKTAFTEMLFSQVDLDKKKAFIDRVFQISDNEMFCDANVAEFVVALNLKQWSLRNNRIEKPPFIDHYKSVKNVLLKTIFELGFSENIDSCKNESQLIETYTVDSSLLEYFTEKMKVFTLNTTNMLDVSNNYLCYVLFLSNILGFMVDYNIISLSEVNGCDISCAINKLLNNRDMLRELEEFKDHKVFALKRDKFLSWMKILDQICSSNSSVANMVKSFISEEFLKVLCGILNQLMTVNKRKHDEFKNSLIKVLASYCCITNGHELSSLQKRVLNRISMPDYNFTRDSDFAMCAILLRELKHIEINYFPPEILQNALDCILNMAKEKHQYYDSAKAILEILYDLYPFIAKSDNEEIKSRSVEFMSHFFNNRTKYGKEISLCILDCMQQLCKVDPKGHFALLENVPVVTKIHHFLVSDYQEVRFKAIATLVLFFEHSNSSKSSISDFHRQEEVFASMYDMSVKIFEVSDEYNDDRRIDEILCRTASAVHTFTTLMMRCDTWVENSIISLMKLELRKALGCTEKVLSLLGKQFVSKYQRNLESIIKKWIMEGYSIDHFQFKFFGSENKFDFYAKNMEICLPLFIDTDKNDLITVARQMDLSEEEVLKTCCTNIFSKALINASDSGNYNTVLESNGVQYLKNTLGEKTLRESLINNIDDLLLRLLNVITDEEDMQRLLEDSCLILQRGILYKQFVEQIKFIEQYFWEGDLHIVSFLSDKYVDKIEKILLALKVQFSSHLENGKINIVHRYVVFLNLLMSNLKPKSGVIPFLIRDTIHSVIHLTRNHISDNRTASALLRTFNIFIRKVLPHHVKYFENSLIFTVNSLKSIVISNPEFSTICISILQFIITDNVAYLSHNIKILDEFPQTADFDRIRTIHHNIKYEDNEVKLVTEIEHFLENPDMETRQGSLMHLRQIISNEKQQLEDLISELKKMRGFSEDCEKSLLHRLISRLINMTISGNQEVSVEARKCLGEIGPINLSTLVLLPESKRLNVHFSPSDLLTAHIISLLCQYIIDPDINVAQKASEALYLVLSYKEGKLVADRCATTDFGNGLIPKHQILPFYYPLNKTLNSSNTSINAKLFSELVDDSDTWCPKTETVTHCEWIRNLVSALFRVFYKSFLPDLVPLCSVKISFCENILQYIIYLLLKINNSTLNEAVSTRINEFFATHWRLTTGNTPSQNNFVAVNKKSVKCMLEAINFIREQDFLVDHLKFNFLAIAKAAEFCSSHFAVILYAELWCRNKVAEIENSENELDTIKSTLFDVVYENESELVGRTLYNILTKAYKAIGDLDALGGCGMSYLLQPSSLVEYHKILGKSNDVLHYYHTELSQGSDIAKQGFIESLKTNFLFQVPIHFSDEPQYECLWRLSQWKTSSTSKNLDLQVTENCKDYEKYKFFALKALLCDKDEYNFKNMTQSMGTCVVNNLKNMSLDCCQNIYPTLVQLQSMIEMEKFADAMKTKNFDGLLKGWKVQDNIIRKNDFQYIEPIVSQRFTMLSEISKFDVELKEPMSQFVLDFAEYAKQNGQYTVASSLVQKLQLFPGLSEDINVRIQLMKAQLALCNNETDVGTYILSKIGENDKCHARLRSKALNLLAQCMVDTNSDGIAAIDLFHKSSKLIGNIANSEKTLEDYASVQDTNLKLALFADQEYQVLATHLKSAGFQKKEANIIRQRELAKNIECQKRKTEDEMKASRFHLKQSNIDEIEIKNAKENKNRRLLVALKFYIKCLIDSDDNNIMIFRLMSLFLENRDNPHIKECINSYIPKIPSYKYITMLPQLMPHISDATGDFFNRHINIIIEKCSIDHPHHTLPLLLALKNSCADRVYTNSKTRTSVNDAKTVAAVRLLKTLERKPELTELIHGMQRVSDGMVELAYFQDHDGSGKTRTIPTKLKFSKLKQVDVLVPTYHLEINKRNSYENIPTISKFSNNYTLVGGINAPKLISCTGSDGVSRPMLIKGNDDLRQDAVMQQVFTIMNGLLTANKETQNLRIRTYKVVPFSMRSGVLEWVVPSVPLGEYLTGKEGTSGAHVKFRPTDLTPLVCRKRFSKGKDKTFNEKFTIYKDICDKFKPVFHRFFETSFPHPTVWYERRRAYIHSVATTSMCGYILGIGDRHVSNILFDTQTAEVIHIDFGIAFEQGKCLPTPETVPFRLTRDIVDGMGVSGVEGLFRKSCEKTMEVLRKNSQTIITILEVLLYDPLYAWTVTPSEANKRQTDEDLIHDLTDDVEEENKNVSAERALLRLRSKLQGTEDGKLQNIENQVRTLIQQAMNPANLCKLFHGWQPYL